jgi:hypothetical protein
MQEVHGIIDFFDGDVAAAADVSLAVFSLRADIEEYRPLCSPAAVDFLVDIDRFKNIQN